MIVIAYPAATGGKFMASLIAILLHDKANQILKNGSLHGIPNGFVQYDVKDTGSLEGYLQREWEGFLEFITTIENTSDTVIVGHMRNLSMIAENFPDAKLVYLTIATEKWKNVQEQNFIKKIMRGFWNRRWYSIFCPPGGPEFTTDIDDMPEFFIQGILNINRNYINTWEYNLPESPDQLLNLDMSCIMNPVLLLEQLIAFLQIEPSQERYNRSLHFINEYVKINEYHNG